MPLLLTTLGAELQGRRAGSWLGGQGSMCPSAKRGRGGMLTLGKACRMVRSEGLPWLKSQP